MACIKCPYAPEFQLSDSKKTFKQKIRIRQAGQREKLKQKSEEDETEENGEREIKQQFMINELPYKATLSNMTD